MSITYSDAAPPNYEAPDFCPQDPNLAPRFMGEEPLVLSVGAVDTGFQTVSLKLRQGVRDEDQNISCTQKAIEDVQDERVPNVQDGYDSDNTEKRWAQDKKEILATAERIAQTAKALGKSPEVAVRSSELGKTLSEQAITEVLSHLNINQPATVAPFQPPPVPNTTAKRVSRVKRPLQQIAASNTADDEAFEAEQGELKKKTRHTYGKRH